jgi:D-glycero-D-manno-heptose 1,7-bisphosphate phosphatase
MKQKIKKPIAKKAKEPEKVFRRLSTGTMLCPVLVLDVDGTLQKGKSGKTFITGPDDIELLPNVVEVLTDYRKRGYIIVLASNQGGVAFGHKTVQQVEEETEKLVSMLPPATVFAGFAALSMEGGSVDDFAYRSLLRKPYYGMLVQAEMGMRERGMLADWDNSLFVGDMGSDQKAAEAAGVKFIWAEEFFNWNK